MMAEDETATVKTIASYRVIMASPDLKIIVFMTGAAFRQP
jgi:hypothetical protein